MIKQIEQKWIDALRAAGHEVRIWKPSHWFSGEIEQRLLSNKSQER